MTAAKKQNANPLLLSDVDKKIVAELLLFLKNLPDNKKCDLDFLINQSKTNIIITGVLGGNIKNITVQDFTILFDNRIFLNEISKFFRNYGKKTKNIDALLLAEKLIVACQDFFDQPSEDFAFALATEANIKSDLAILGYDSINNFYAAIELLQKARNDGLDPQSQEFMFVLMDEGDCWYNLAKWKNDEISNFSKALERFDDAWDFGIEPKSDDYKKILNLKAIIQMELAKRGVNAITNCKNAINNWELLIKTNLDEKSQQFVNYQISLAGILLSNHNCEPVRNLEISREILVNLLQLPNLSHIEIFLYTYTEISILNNFVQNWINPIENLKESEKKIMELQSLSEGIPPIFYDMAQSEGGFIKILFAEFGIDIVENLKKSLILFESVKSHGIINEPEEVGRIYGNEGFARMLLADQNIDSVNNLHAAINLFSKARNCGLIEKTPSFAWTFVNEGVSKRKLAELGEDPIDNLKQSINLYKLSRKMGLLEGSPQYAGTYLNEAISRYWLAEFGDTIIGNCETAKNLFQRARSGLISGSKIFALTYSNEANLYAFLAGLGINPIQNLTDAVVYYEKARNSGMIKNTYDFALTYLNEASTRWKLAEFGQNNVENLVKSFELYSSAIENGFAKGSIDYAIAVKGQGTVKLKLAVEGFDQIENLSDSITLFYNARNGGIPLNSSLYGGCLLNEGIARNELIKLHIEEKLNFSLCEKLFKDSIHNFEQTDSIFQSIQAYQHLGYLYLAANHLPESYEAFKSAILLMEDVRTSIKIQKFKTMYHETVANIYSKMVFICLALGKNEEAFRFAEASKGRTFLEILANGKQSFGKTDTVQKYSIFLESQKNVEFSNSTNDQREGIRDNYKKRLEEKSSLLNKIKIEDPEFYSLTTIEPIKIEELIKTLNGRILIEFFWGEKLTVFIIDNSLKVVIIQTNQHDLYKKIVDFRIIIDIIERNEETKDDILIAEQLLKDLYSILIKPIKEKIQNVESLVIIPDKFLYLIPFQALNDGTYLTEKYKISYAQTATSLKYLSKGKGVGSLVIGIPQIDTDGIKDEAIKIARILHVQPLLGSEATKDRIIERIKNKKIVHFAAHGHFDHNDPANSGIILNEDLLTVSDFMSMTMDAEMTIISTCESGLSHISYGGEIEGLVRSVQYAGSRFVITSLWKVDGQATLDFFLSFYNENGDITLKMKKTEMKKLQTSHFYYWAPFQVYGI